MSEQTVQALAEVLAEHVYDYGGYECSCGQDGLDRQEAKRHQARAVLDSGLVVPAWWGGAVAADLAAARKQLNQVRELFAGGPDTPCRTTWPDGIECVEVPMSDLRRVLDVAIADETGGA